MTNSIITSTMKPAQDIYVSIEFYSQNRIILSHQIFCLIDICVLNYVFKVTILHLIATRLFSPRI